MKALVLFLELSTMAMPARFSPWVSQGLKASQSGDVVTAIEPRATRCAGRLKQASLLVRPEVLDARAYQVGGDGDPVDPAQVHGARGHDRIDKRPRPPRASVPDPPRWLPDAVYDLSGQGRS